MRKALNLGLTLVMLVSGLTALEFVAAETAEAATVPEGMATYTPLGIASATDMAVAGTDLYVASESVEVFSSAGAPLATVEATGGVGSVETRADGSVVYAAITSGSQLKAVDVASRAVTQVWTTKACPRALKVDGDVAYYIFGCAESRGVASLDLASGENRELLLTTTNYINKLAASGTTLIVATAGDLTAYAIGSDGALTQRGQWVGQVNDLALSPDGQTLLTQGSSQDGMLRLAAADLSEVGGSAATPRPTAVAWSPDGASFAGAISGAGEVARVFDGSDGSLISRSGCSASSMAVLPGTLWFTDGGTRLSVLVSGGGASGISLVKPATRRAYPNNLVVKLTSPSSYGRSLRLDVTTSCPGCQLRLTIKDGVAGTRTFTRTTSATGFVRVLAAVKGTGFASVHLPQGLLQLGKTVSGRYTVPAKVVVTSKGTFTLRQGVAHYKSGRTPAVGVTFSPRRSARITLTMQRWTGSAWKSAGSAEFKLPTSGSMTITFPGWDRKVRYRARVVFAGDTINGKAKVVYSRPFMID